MSKTINIVVLAILVSALAACQDIPLTTKKVHSFFPAITENNYFIPGTEDIPLHPKFSPENIIQNVAFDSIEGRIIEAEFFSPNTDTSEAEVLEFYKQSLPQLGWEPQGGNTYIREKEQITIKSRRINKYVHLYCHIKPI